MFSELEASKTFVDGLRKVEALAVQAKGGKAGGDGQKMKKILDLLKGLQSGMDTSQKEKLKSSSRRSDPATGDGGDPLLKILTGKSPVP